MKRDELDAWFAEADDVLRTWDGSTDAMAAHTAHHDVDPELPYIPGDRDVVFPLRRRPAPRRGRAARVISSTASLARLAWRRA